MTEPSPQGSGAAKVIVILAIVGLIGVTFVGAGTYVFLNRDKIFSSSSSGNEEEAPAEAQAPGAAAQAVTGLPLDQLRAGVTRRPVVASAPIHANERNYATYAKRDDILVLVDYYADWCGPCRGIAPSLARLASVHGDKVVVLKVNIDREKTLAQRAGIRSIPDVRLLHGGRQLERVIGGRPYSDYESLVLKHASKLAPPPSAAPQPVSKPAQPGGSITPLKKDWLPPGVERTK